ncbi:MAG TPA: LacI family DNA-binding transcriptional regulator [Opitutaceae bacterium]|jgi:LacI family transcriptional regulator
MQRRVTLRDLAERCNVHISTVSLALRNSPRLSHETRTRVQATAKEMGYAHDTMLDALVAYRDSVRRQSNPPVLGYVTSWVDDVEQIPHHRLYWSGAKKRASELGFRLEYFSLRAPGMTDTRLANILVTRGIVGIVLSSIIRAEVRFDWDKFTAVRIELHPYWPRFSTTAVDHVRAMIEAIHQALSLGYRRPGLVLEEDWSELAEDHWKMGFLWAQQRLEPGDRCPVYLYKPDWKRAGQGSDGQFESWYMRYRPDVLIGPHGQIEARSGTLGLNFPGDAAVIDPFLETPHPFYAGIIHDFEEVGARAIENLAAALTRNQRGVPPVMVRSYVDGSWQPGPSCPRAAPGALRGPVQ